MTFARVLAASVVALTVLAQNAAAQDWQHRRPPSQPPQSQWQPGPPRGGGGGACVPSGFARLTRNCSVNTGGCQRLPVNCNRGWCCP
jgi:hypothetical protein